MVDCVRLARRADHLDGDETPVLRRQVVRLDGHRDTNRGDRAGTDQELSRRSRPPTRHDAEQAVLASASRHDQRVDPRHGLVERRVGGQIQVHPTRGKLGNAGSLEKKLDWVDQPIEALGVQVGNRVGVGCRHALRCREVGVIQQARLAGGGV